MWVCETHAHAAWCTRTCRDQCDVNAACAYAPPRGDTQLCVHDRVEIAEHVPLSKDCPLEAADTFAVALAARRSWFCCHRLFAVLPRFARRRPGGLKKAALGRGVFLVARMWVLRHVAGRRCVGLRPGRAG